MVFFNKTLSVATFENMAYTALQSRGEGYEVAVVDREKNVSFVTESLYNLEPNVEILSTGKFSTYRVTIPVAPHLSGSGKSAFVKKYLKLLRQFGDRSLEDSSVDPSRKSFLENLKNAAFMYVDLKELESTISFEEKRSLSGQIITC